MTNDHNLSPMPNDHPTRRFRFSLRQLFLLVALVAIGMAIGKWVFRKVVVVRAPRAEDRVFGDESLKSRRNVAVVSGRFMKGTYSSVKLYLVQSGIVAEIHGHFLGREKAEKGGPIWESATMRLGLGEYPLTGGQRTDLLMTGEIPGGSIASTRKSTKHNFNVVAKETLPGRITPGRPHIIYIEGDQAIVVDGSMTVEEFARANTGNYLVVTVEIR